MRPNFFSAAWAIALTAFASITSVTATRPLAPSFSISPTTSSRLGAVAAAR